jgi:hypothetical protein
MTENAVVRARIDARIKNEAAAVLSAMGLTVSDAPDDGAYCQGQGAALRPAGAQ